MSTAEEKSPTWRDEKQPGDASEEAEEINEETIEQRKDDEASVNSGDVDGDGDRDSQEYDDEDSEEDIDEDLDADLYVCLSNNRCCGRCCGVVLKKFPRTCLFTMGVVVPLLTLIFLSIIFGLILSRLESQGEVDQNDQILAKQYVYGRTRRTVTRVTEKVPRVCLEAYISGEDPVPFDQVLIDWILQPDFDFRDNNTELLANVSSTANFTRLWDFMVECGAGSREYADLKFEEAKEALEAIESLTFNWIRCYDGAHDLKVDISSDVLQKDERSPERQAAYYTEMWLEDYNRTLDEYITSAESVSDLFSASDKALEEATAGDKCYLNGAGSAWFWFTIQTTIGYGNQSPVSRGGRILIFTAGFICILAFGAVLATAGQIVLALVDDYCMRHSRFLSFLAKPWWACLFWGGLWYSWMVAIALGTMKWKEKRLDQDMSFWDAYWFSYISTTTVGLGDYYLEPEVFVGIDLLYFPLLMLIGFTFLSAFLGKLAELLTVLHAGAKRSFVDTMLLHMKYNEDKKSKKISERIENMEQSKVDMSSTP